MLVKEYFFTIGRYIGCVEEWECLRGLVNRCRCPKCMGKRGYCLEIRNWGPKKRWVRAERIPRDRPGYGLEAFFERWDGVSGGR